RRGAPTARVRGVARGQGRRGNRALAAPAARRGVRRVQDVVHSAGLNTNLPRIILTSGEPAGIGPDLCLKLAESDWHCDLVIAADPDLLRARANLLGLDPQIEEYALGAERTPHRARCLRVTTITLTSPVEAGRLNAANARYVLALLDRAIDGCTAGEFDA